MKLRIIGNLFFVFFLFGINADTKFHIALEKAIEDNSSQAIRFIADYNFFSDMYNFNRKNEDGDTIIMFAIKHNNIDVVKSLVYRDSINLNIRNHNLETALILAIKKGNIKIINLILDSYDKLDKEININAQDINGNTAFIYSILSNNIKTADRLLSMNTVNILLKNRAGESGINILFKTSSDQYEKFINLFEKKYMNRIREDVKNLVINCKSWQDIIFIEKDKNLLKFLEDSYSGNEEENITKLISAKYKFFKEKEIFKLANACNSLECLDKLVAKLYKEKITIIYEPSFVSDLVELFKKNFGYKSNEDFILTSKLLKLENLSRITSCLINKNGQNSPNPEDFQDIGQDKNNFEKSGVLKELLQEGYTKTANLLIKSDSSGKLGEESLILAIKEQNYNIIKIILEQYKIKGKLEKLNLDKQDINGNSFFINAAIQEDQELINLLVQYNVSMVIKNSSGKTGLDILFEKKSFKSVMIISLIEAISTYPTEIAAKIEGLINKCDTLEQINDLIPNLHKYIDTLEDINLEEASYFANIFTNILAAKFKYKDNKDIVMSSYYLKLDYLFNVIRNLVKVVNTFEGIPPINIRELCDLVFSNDPTNSVLISLMSFGCIKTCALLIDKDLYLHNIDLDGNNPLIMACLMNHKDIIKMLIAKKAVASFISSSGITALHAAVIGKCDEEIFKLLLLNGATNSEESCAIQTPLMLSVETDNQIACKFLSQHNIQLDLVDVEQNTVLMKAIISEKWDLVKILLQSQASVSIQNINKQNSLNLISTKLNSCQNMSDKIKIQELIKLIRAKIYTESTKVIVRKHINGHKKRR